MPGFRQGSSGEVARCHEDSLGGRAQGSPETVYFWASHCVPPTLHLRLHVGSREELIRFLHVRVEVYAAVARRPSNGYSHEAALFQ